MTSQQVTWFADLVAAAEELGYGVVQVAPREITLTSLRERYGVEQLTVRTVLLSGDELRRILRPIRPRIENSEPFGALGEPRP